MTDDFAKILLLRRPTMMAPGAMPPLGRMMVFVDGENLALRFRDVRKTFVTEIHPSVSFEEDVYVWAPSVIACRFNVVQRATYYTSCTGDSPRHLALEERIKDLSFEQYRVYNVSQPPALIRNLTPCVLRKAQKERKSKGVDIKISVDILTNVFQNNLDTVYLVTADGDFAPLIDECHRQGKQVFVAALTHGLNPRLKVIADEFLNLDGILFSQIGEKREK